MLIFELLQVALGRRDRLSMTPSASEWQHLHQLSEQQSLQGICYAAVKRLPKDQWPDEQNLIDWIWESQRIAERNKLLSERSAQIYEHLAQEGFDACLLKGQGNALLYGELSSQRQVGDIDIWTLPHDNPTHQPKRRVVEYVRKRFPNAFLRFHHIEYPLFDDAEVEIHFSPVYLNNPFLNRKLNAWYGKQRGEQMQHKVKMGDKLVAVPTLQFNALYQLLHIYKHIFEEGIGLRQMMDYYFVLDGLNKEALSRDTRTSRESRDSRISRYDDLLAMIKTLKLEPLAGAVMYVMREVFGMKEDELYCAPRRKEGLSLLSEIMQAGNFGHFDTRYDKEKLSRQASMRRYWRKTRRNFVFACYYPSEGFWEPLFRLYHFFWRIFNLWKI